MTADNGENVINFRLLNLKRVALRITEKNTRFGVTKKHVTGKSKATPQARERCHKGSNEREFRGGWVPEKGLPCLASRATYASGQFIAYLQIHPSLPYL